MQECLIYHDRSSQDFGAYVNYPLAPISAKRDISNVSIPGLSGDYLNDNLKFQNATQSISFTVLRPHKYTSWFEWLLDFQDWLIQKNNTFKYEQIRLSMWREYTYIGYVSDAPTMTIINEQRATVTINLNCKPFLMRTDGLIFRNVPNIVTNTEIYNSQPVFHIIGSGDYILTINDIDYKLFGVDDEIFIDSENYLIYKSLNENRSTVAQFPNNDFPILKAGTNHISLTGNFSKFEYKPNWRRLL